MLDCQLGALGELADELDGAFAIIQDKLKLLQDKINSIPGFVDASLVAEIIKLRQLLDGQFPSIMDLLNGQIQLPGEILKLVDLANDALAFKREVELLKEKYEDADLELLKDPTKISDMLRDLQGDLNRLCDLVPTLEKDEDGNLILKGRGNTKLEVLSRPGIKMKSLFSKSGRKAAAKDIIDAVSSIEIIYVHEDGSGKINKSGFNSYGW